MEELKIDIRIPIPMTIAILAGGFALDLQFMGQANTNTLFIFPTDFPALSAQAKQ